MADLTRFACENCERCTWNPGPDCGIAEHRHCEKCGHCEGRHVPLAYAQERGWDSWGYGYETPSGAMTSAAAVVGAGSEPKDKK